MPKSIRILATTGALLSLSLPALGQIEPVTSNGRLPIGTVGNYPSIALTLSPDLQPEVIWLSGLPNWTNDVFLARYDTIGHIWNSRLVTNSIFDWATIWSGRDGKLFVSMRNQLYIEEDTGFVSRAQSGYFSMDSLGVFHGLFKSENAMQYGLSRDTAQTTEQLIRLPFGDSALGISLSPDNGRYAALTMRDGTVYKYSGFAGQAVDTANVLAFPNGESMTEWAIDNEGYLFSMVLLPGIDNRHELYGWSEQYGLSWIADIEYPPLGQPRFELIFCPSQDAIIAIMSAVNTSSDSTNFFFTIDGGGSWNVSAARLRAGNASCPRLISDTLYLANEVSSQWQVNVTKIAVDSVLATFVSTDDDIHPPAGTSLGNYPNPFNRNTVISFNAINGRNVKIEIFDIAGRLMDILYNGRFESDRGRIEWDAGNSDGRNLPSGLYFARLTDGEKTISHKMLLLK